MSIGKTYIIALLMFTINLTSRFRNDMVSSLSESKTLFVTSLLCSKKLLTLSRIIWYAIMANTETTCHKNQTSINFMYDVLGRSLFTAFINVAITRRAVPAPIKRLLNPSSVGSIKRVEYPNSQRITVGKNVFKN